VLITDPEFVGCCRCPLIVHWLHRTAGRHTVVPDTGVVVGSTGTEFGRCKQCLAAVCATSGYSVHSGRIHTLLGTCVAKRLNVEGKL
jgi:hypothetical protein